MKLFGTRQLWSYGLFPVIAAAAFQLVVIYRAQADLGSYYLAQSVIAIGISLSSLQPRTWNKELRTGIRTRWSFLFTSIFLFLCTTILGFTHLPLKTLLCIFIFKKFCDIAREFYFLSSFELRTSALLLITVLEALGLVLLILDLKLYSLIVYFIGALTSVWVVFWSTRDLEWSSPAWARREFFAAGTFTLYNMGSRFFMVSTPSMNAHLIIGSLLQAGNFMSPITFSLYSKHRRGVFLIAGFVMISIMTILGTSALTYFGDPSVGAFAWISTFSFLTSLNAALFINFMNSRSTRARNLVGIVSALWVTLSSILARLDLVSWEVGFSIFLLVNTVLICLARVRFKTTPTWSED